MKPKDKSNYAILESNKKALLKFIEKIEINPAPDSSDIQDNYTKIKESLKKYDFSTAIAKLDETKDNKLGINWSESEDLGNGTKALIRDARNVTEDENALKHDAGEKYAMQILNQVRAGLSLIDQSNLGEEELKIAEQKLMHVATNAVDEVDKLDSKKIKVYNTQIIHVLDEAKIPYKHMENGKEKYISSAQQLNFAKEIVGLKDEHKHIVTLSSIEDQHEKKHMQIEADIMLNGLTQEQKKQYEHIATSEPGISCGVEWFDKMPKHKQNLLRDVADEIASGKKVLPSQMIGDLAGLKNAYQKVTAIKSPDVKSKILLESFHCGTPASKIKILDKEQTQQIVDENIRQIRSYLKKGQNVNLNILNSKTAFDVRNENLIIEQVKTSAKNIAPHSNSIFYPPIYTPPSASVSPINKFRLFGAGRDLESFEFSLKKIGKEIDRQKIIPADKEKPIIDRDVTNFKFSTVKRLNTFEDLYKLTFGTVVNILKITYRVAELAAFKLEELYLERKQRRSYTGNNIAEYLKHGSSLPDRIADLVPFDFIKSKKTKALEDIKKIENNGDEYYSLTKDLKVAIEARSLIDTPVFLSKSENSNLELTSYMLHLQNSTIKGGLKDTFGKNRLYDLNNLPINVNFCKSGKDRTGYVETIQTKNAILTHLDIEAKSTAGNNIFKKQVSGGHTQQIAGIQGGTIGCHSIKTNPEFGLNKEHKAAQGILNQKSAKFNSKIKVATKEKQDEIIEKFENSFDKSSKLPTRTKADKEQATQTTKRKSKKHSIAIEVINKAEELGVNARKSNTKKANTRRDPNVKNGTSQGRII